MHLLADSRMAANLSNGIWRKAGKQQVEECNMAAISELKILDFVITKLLIVTFFYNCVAVLFNNNNV